jgi:hypothetical protein
VIAFEISVNGHHIRTISVGEFGTLHSNVCMVRTRCGGTIHEGFRVLYDGLDEKADNLRWPYTSLKLGDAVTIRIVEVDSLVDPPSERVSQEELRRLMKQQRPEGGHE